MDNKTYNFECGLTAYQNKLTLRQIMSVGNLLSDLMPDNDKPNLKEIAKSLFNNTENILELLLILLNFPEGTDKSSLLELTADELSEVLTDFFSINKTSMNFLLQSGTQSGFLTTILNSHALKPNLN